ncbi:hypothetical protein N7513_010639 [Penicillium frequentans]|nr:hypothetical protein N7513_010639 [Penicillium glabrum]
MSHSILSLQRIFFGFESMSSPSTARERPLYQPFQCVICQRRFTRHENLKRHATLHSRLPSEASLPCPFCQVKFSRSDLRHRHIRRKHPEKEPKSPTKRPRCNEPRQHEEGESHQDKVSGSLPPLNPQLGLQVQESTGDGGFSPEERRWEVVVLDTDFHTSNGRHTSEEEVMKIRSALPGNYSPHDDGNDDDGDDDVESARDGSYSINPIVAHSTNSDHNLLATSCFPDRESLLDCHLQSDIFNMDLPSLDIHQSVSRRISTHSFTHSQSQWYPSMQQILRGCCLFFTHVSPFLPFIHKATFDPCQARSSLVLSVLSLGFQYGEDPDLGKESGTGTQLSKMCFHQAQALLFPDQQKSSDSSENIIIVQSYLLLQVCSMMYFCGKDSVYGLKVHSAMIALARKSGLMQPMPTEPTTAHDLDSLWHGFIKAESHKRTSFAVHQIDALWYQCLSIPRSISHLEVKHDLPCPVDQWLASSAAEWAHCQLVTGHISPSLQYADAVRRFLSPDGDLESIPCFDPYGAVNIAQFLMSSAREISGWSTMTGMLSIERFGALRSSLVALGPFSRAQPGGQHIGHVALCEATWETAMIELQMWSPSHTGGIVEESIDAVLNHSTYLAPSCDLLCEGENAAMIQPHVDWFLRYLNSSDLPDSEAPWVILYAYKAFLVAWQLLRGGQPGAMRAICIEDGDIESALTWAKVAFRQRERWQIGKLILACLDELDK